jgi:hypothetical protein
MTETVIGPVPSKIASGNPRSLATPSGRRRTRNRPSDVWPSIAGHSRAQSSKGHSMEAAGPFG